MIDDPGYYPNRVGIVLFAANGFFGRIVVATE
jgi:hypothetical protein